MAEVLALPPGHPYLWLPLQFGVGLEPRLVSFVSVEELRRLRQDAENELQEPARWGTTFTVIQSGPDGLGGRTLAPCLSCTSYASSATARINSVVRSAWFSTVPRYHPSVGNHSPPSLGFSETVYVDDPDTGQLRIFTPAAELPFAGHPLVGTAWLLSATSAVR